MIQQISLVAINKNRGKAKDDIAAWVPGVAGGDQQPDEMEGDLEKEAVRPGISRRQAPVFRRVGF
jgi:hypothetical protein